MHSRDVLSLTFKLVQTQTGIYIISLSRDQEPQTHTISASPGVRVSVVQLVSDLRLDLLHVLRWQSALSAACLAGEMTNYPLAALSRHTHAHVPTSSPSPDARVPSTQV